MPAPRDCCALAKRQARLLTSSTPTPSPSQRLFSTSTQRPVVFQHRTRVLDLLPPEAPKPLPYPYPTAQWYKQRDRGLYGGQMIQFGHSITGEKKVNKNPSISNRYWRPNRQPKHLYSRVLGRYLRMRVTTKTLRTIEKVGGVDNYVCGTSASRIQELGTEGWNVRSVLMRTKNMRKLMKGDEKVMRYARKMDRLQAEWQAVIAGRSVALPEIPMADPTSALEMEPEPVVQKRSPDELMERTVVDSITRAQRRASEIHSERALTRLTFGQRMWIAVTQSLNPRNYLPRALGGRDIRDYGKAYGAMHGRKKPPPSA